MSHAVPNARVGDTSEEEIMHLASRITLVGLASIILACGGDATPTAPDIDGFGGALTAEKKPGKGKPPDEIPLTMTFGDAGGDGVKSDGGAYVDGRLGGLDGVEAFIRSNGNFLLSVAQSSSRTLCLEFPGSSSGFPDNLFAGISEFCLNQARISMSNAFRSLEGGLPAMGIGDTMRAAVSVRWDVNWMLFYGRVCESNSESVDENRVTITRPDEFTWTIAGGNAILCEDVSPEHGRGQVTRTHRWTGAMPFSLKASVKPPQ